MLLCNGNTDEEKAK